MRRKLFFLICMLLLPFTSDAKNVNAYYVPPFLANTYFGAGVGYLNSFYQNSDLRPGLTANTLQTNQFAFSVILGHYFTKNWAWQFHLIQPTGVYAENINGASNKLHITETMLAGTIDRTFWLNKKFGLFAEAGPVYINRKSDNFAGNSIVTNGDHVTGMIGGGLQYFIYPTFLTSVSFDYIFRRNNIPSQIYLGFTGAYYFMQPDQMTKQIIYFPHHEVSFAFFDANAVDVEYSETHIPIFWCGSTKLQYGGMAAYQQMLFHSENIVSIDWGINVGDYVSRELSQNINAFSLFAAVRFWLLRTKTTNLYLGLIAAAPSYISRDVIDNRNIGSHFIFFDQLRLGFILGQKHHVDIGLQFAHYSNGGLFSNNGGVSVPLSLSVGYAF